MQPPRGATRPRGRRPSQRCLPEAGIHPVLGCDGSLIQALAGLPGSLAQGAIGVRGHLADRVPDRGVRSHAGRLGAGRRHVNRRMPAPAPSATGISQPHGRAHRPWPSGRAAPP